MLVCIALGLGFMQANAAENFLKIYHENRIDEAKKYEESAVSAWDKAWAMKQEAAALDSLGRSDEALTVIDRALGMVDRSKSRDLIVTKAGILFHMNAPKASLELLEPEIEATRAYAEGQPAEQRVFALGNYTEGFVTATFAYMQLEQWPSAIKTLADAQAPLEGASFSAYKGLLYLYIMARAKDASLENHSLEQCATYYATHDKGHYGALLRMWRGEDTIKELSRIIGKMDGVEQQEAFGEALFYGGVYAKFVNGSFAGGRGMLENLNRVAPYGSLEWIYGQRVLR